MQDNIHAHDAEPLTPAQLAREGVLAPNRAIQYYRQAFGTPPHREMRRRLAEADGRALPRTHVRDRGGAGFGLSQRLCLQRGVQGQQWPAARGGAAPQPLWVILGKQGHRSVVSWAQPLFRQPVP